MVKEHKFRIEDFEEDQEGNITLPPELLDYIREITNRHHTLDENVIRKIFEAGLLIIQETDEGNAELILRTPDGEEQRVNVFGKGDNDDLSDQLDNLGH